MKRFLTIFIFVAALIQPLSINAQVMKEDNVKMKVNSNDTPYSLIILENDDVKRYNTNVGLQFDILNKILVSDLSGFGNGWILTVQSGQLKNSGYEFPKGSLYLTNDGANKFNSSVIDDGAVEVMRAERGNGAGSLELTFNNGGLVIPKGNYKAESGAYDTKLTWQLVSHEGQILFETETDYKLEVDASAIKAKGGKSDDDLKDDEGYSKKESEESKSSKEYPVNSDNKNDGSSNFRENVITNEEKSASEESESNDVVVDKDGDIMPPTSTNIFNMMLFGIIGIGLGLFMLTIRKMRNK